MDSIQQDEFGKSVADKIADVDSALCLIVSVKKNGDGDNDVTIDRTEFNFSNEVAMFLMVSVASAIKKLEEL